MKYMYVVEYWVPFPQSEYGGLITLIAENDTEALELLSDEESFNEEHNSLIMEKIVTATKLELANDYESGIIEAFCT
jgi:succinate dehydrogenase flavin-adding protein (antitoxin of CptAB toxin-antitoxin module)|tara:strand:- start:2032 stop:2262 length:231 start_codon:yes stop_codon:yes gene_type:complete